MLNSLINALASSSLSWILTPTNTTSPSLNVFHAASKAGASARQGGHQEAQKLINPARPRSSSSRILPPSKSTKSKEGACRPMRGERIKRGSRVKPKARSQINATANPITIARLPTFLIPILLPPRPNPIKPTLSSMLRRFPPKQIEACQGRQNQRHAKYLRRRYAPGKDGRIGAEKLDRKTRNSITSQIG